MRLGLNLGIGGGNGLFDPASVFGAGDDGFLTKLSDFSSMFTDSAETTPVTGAGDPIGALQDRAGNGNVAVQSVNDDYRPTLGRHPRSGARQLLDESGDLSQSPWIATSATVSGGELAPDGTMTAYRVTESTNGFVYRATGVVTDDYVRGIWARTVSGTGTTAINGHTDYPKYKHTLTEDWQFFEDTIVTAETGGANFYAVDFRPGTLTEVLLWHPQLEAGPTATAYQSRVDQYDITEAGQPDVWYMRSDGVDDRSIVPSRFGMSASPAMTVVMAIKPNGQGFTTYAWALGSSTGSINGAVGTSGVSFKHFDGDLRFPAVPDDEFSIITWIKAEGDTYGEGRVRINGVEQTSTSSSSPASVPVSVVESFALMSLSAGGSALASDVCSAMIINRTLTDAEIINVERYFAANAGVSFGPVSIAPTSVSISSTVAFSQQFTATGGAAPYTWSISGTLPTGITLTGDTLSGTTTDVETTAYSFTIRATDANGDYVTQAFSGTVQAAASGNPLPVAAGTLHFALPNSPDGIALDAGGNLWVADANGNGITKHVGFTSTVDITVDATGNYRGIAYEPVGDNIYGAEFDDGKARVYAAADGSAGTNYNFAGPRGMCIFDGKLIMHDGSNVVVHTDLTTDTVLQTHTVASLGLSAANPAAMGTDGANIMIGSSSGATKIVTGESMLTATPVILETLAITGYEPSGFMHDGTNWYGCDRSTTDGVYIHANA